MSFFDVPFHYVSIRKIEITSWTCVISNFKVRTFYMPCDTNIVTADTVGEMYASLDFLFRFAFDALFDTSLGEMYVTDSSFESLDFRFRFAFDALFDTSLLSLDSNCILRI